MHQGKKRTEDNRVECGIAVPRQLPETIGDAARDAEADREAGVAQHRRPQPVCGKLDDRQRAGKLLTPVAPEPLAALAREDPLLAAKVIGQRDGQWGKLRWCPAALFIVQSPKIAQD